MNTSSSRVKLSVVLGLAFAGLAFAGCASSSAAALPAGVPVHGLVTNSMTLHGVGETTLTSATCTVAAPASPKHVIHLEEGTRAAIFLGPEKGHPPLPVTMLHITHLESNRTWCVMTKPDGTPAAIAADFPSGMYAVSVAEPRSSSPRRYEITLEKL
jgi:hypothetical protein